MKCDFFSIRATLLPVLFLAAHSSLQPAPLNPRPAAKVKTILMVIAHPDDENIIGAVLSKISRQGNKVYIVIATDGEFHTIAKDLPEGAALAQVRRKESIRACEILGTEPPEFLGHQRLDTKVGVRPYLDARIALMKELKTRIAKLKPDMIFTFGPDGEYGHSEHIVVGAVTTEVLLREGWVEKYPLYYFACTKEQVTDNDELSYMDPRYLSAAVTYTDADEAKAVEAAKAYVSQFSPKEVEELSRVMAADKKNTSYFRRFLVGHAKGEPPRMFGPDGQMDRWPR